MTIQEFLLQLDGVQSRGTRWSARCPAHADKSPSLSVSEGDKGVLLKCWAGCTVDDICRSLGIEQRDLFFDALDSNPLRRREAARARERQQRVREYKAHQQGTLLDALRESDYFVRSRQSLNISTWGNKRLNVELNALADAYRLLDWENLYG